MLLYRRVPRHTPRELSWTNYHSSKIMTDILNPGSLKSCLSGSVTACKLEIRCGVRGLWGARVLGCEGSGVRGFWGARALGCEGSGVRGFWDLDYMYGCDRYRGIPRYRQIRPTGLIFSFRSFFLVWFHSGQNEGFFFATLDDIPWKKATVDFILSFSA